MVTNHRSLGRLFAELRRRHVFRVAALYGAAVFGLLQVLSVVFPALYIPEWVMTVTVVVVLAGFPVAVALGWIFDLTPAGVQRTGPTQEPPAPTPRPPDALMTGQSVVAHRIERLDALLAREGVLPLARAMDIVGQLAASLEAEHRKGRCHGRIAAGSVIVAPDRHGAEVVRLLEVDRTPGATASSASPVTWAAPEQLAGEPADARSDVYALGLLLFRMLTGSDPHPGASSAQRAVARRNTPARRLWEVFPVRRYPDGVQRVLDRALALKREDRQTDARELRQELLHAIEGERGYTGVHARLTREYDMARPAESSRTPPGGEGAAPGRPWKPLLGRMLLLGTITVGIAALALRISAFLVARPPGRPPAEASLQPFSTLPSGGGSPRPKVASPTERHALRPAQPSAAAQKHGVAAGNDPSPTPAGPPALHIASWDATLLLARLSERSTASATEAALQGVHDSAAAVWQDAAVPGHARAFAAFLAGNAQSALHSPSSCAAWVQRALALDPKPDYRHLLRVCSDSARVTRKP